MVLLFGLVGAVWRLSAIIGKLDAKISVNSVKTDETNKDVVALTAKLEGAIIQLNAVQARTIRLEEKVDKATLTNNKGV